jgi:hypothetical protein
MLSFLIDTSFGHFPPLVGGNKREGEISSPSPDLSFPRKGDIHSVLQRKASVQADDQAISRPLREGIKGRGRIYQKKGTVLFFQCGLDAFWDENRTVPFLFFPSSPSSGIGCGNLVEGSDH